ncbi:myelocytomatosis oncogene homolog [Heptranchias perlo]|uniref:myelocytomatosis oncogene homolog n=1 Tax=Heptranchias perlo TaxID=212740 RepID=UPI00355A9100
MPQSGNIDCELDIFPSLLEEEDFYQTCEDFLKSVEMLPTPPLPKANLCESLSNLIPSKSDQLELMSELLLDDEELLEQSFIWDLEASLKMEPSMITQDCMWSSLLATAELDRVGEKLDALPVTSPLMSEIESQFFQDLSGSGLESIGPCLGSPDQENEDQISDDEGSLSTGSGSSSSSDLEEEIDVVTIEKQTRGAGSGEEAVPRRSETRSQILASIKRCSLEIQQQHNYAAPSPQLAREQPAPKRTKTDSYLQHSSPNRSKSSSPRSSDAEDEDRRRTHNVLERQRRNELKHCLFSLRDQVPELSKNDKASKVVILRKATEYVSRLKAEEQKLIAEREKLHKKQQQLRRRLEQRTSK